MKRYNKISMLIFLVLTVAAISIVTNSCTHPPYVLPENMRTGDPTICFERDVLPIFQSNCAKSGACDSKNDGFPVKHSYKWNFH